MRSFRMKTVVIAASLVLLGTLGVVSAYAAPTTKVRVCALGQKTAKAEPCTVNADLGKPGCAKFESSVQSIIGSAPSGFTVYGTSTDLDCYYAVNGTKQAFSIRAFGGFPLSEWNKGFPQDVAQAATLSCVPVGGTGPMWPASPPVMLTGLGDSAFAWDVCQPPGQNGTTEVDVRKGAAVYVVEGQYPAVSVSVAQLETFIRQLMTTVK